MIPAGGDIQHNLKHLGSNCILRELFLNMNSALLSTNQKTNKRNCFSVKSMYFPNYYCTRHASVHHKLFYEGILKIFINISVYFLTFNVSKPLSLIKLMINIQACMMSTKVTSSQEERTVEIATFRPCRNTGREKIIFLDD